MIKFSSLFILALFLAMASIAQPVDDLLQHTSREDLHQQFVQKQRLQDLAQTLIFVNGQPVSGNLHEEILDKRNISVELITDSTELKVLTSDTNIRSVIIIHRDNLDIQDSVANRSNYDSIALIARNFFQQSKYLLAADKFTYAIRENSDMGLVNDRYMLACSYAQLKEVDSAFKQLFRIAKKGNYFNFPALEHEAKLEVLHTDARWAELISIVKMNAERLKPHY